MAWLLSHTTLIDHTSAHPIEENESDRTPWGSTARICSTGSCSNIDCKGITKRAVDGIGGRLRLPAQAADRPMPALSERIAGLRLALRHNMSLAGSECWPQLWTPWLRSSTVARCRL